MTQSLSHISKDRSAEVHANHNSAHVSVVSPGSNKAVPPNGKRPPANVRLWTPLFVLITATTLCCFMVGQGLSSGMSVYLIRTGESAVFAGVLAAVFSIASGAARLVCGPTVDRFGRIPIMFSGMALLLLGTIVPALVFDPVVFLLCRIVQGIGFSAATTASATAAADVLPRSRLGEGIGYYGLGQALAMSIGPALALFLVTTDPAENLFFGLTAIAVLGLALVLGCRYEKNPSRLPETAEFRKKWETERKTHLNSDQGEAQGAKHDEAQNTAEPLPQKNKHKTTASPSTERGLRRVLEVRALPGALPMLVLSPAFGFSIFFMGLYGTSLGIGNPGLFYTLSALSMVVVRLNSKAFMDRTAPIKVFGVATACGFLGFALLLGAGIEGAPEVCFYAAGLLYGVCLGVSMPLNQAVAVKNTPPSRWGATNALYLLAIDLSIGFSSLLWGFMNDAFGFYVTILCVMACIIASFLVARITYAKVASN